MSNSRERVKEALVDILRGAAISKFARLHGLIGSPPMPPLGDMADAVADALLSLPAERGREELVDAVVFKVRAAMFAYNPGLLDRIDKEMRAALSPDAGGKP